jgi:hypothetical protein
MRELMWAGKTPFVRTDGGRKIYFDMPDLDEGIEKNKTVFRKKGAHPRGIGRKH